MQGTGGQQQIEFPYENIYDALRAAVQSAGGAKVVGHMLWPAKPVADAHRELLDALNRDRPRKLDPEEVLRVLRLARDAGFHAAKHFVDDHTGYVRGAPMDPQVARDKAIEAVQAAAQALARATAELERSN